jgi:hypothetical protein
VATAELKLGKSWFACNQPDVFFSKFASPVTGRSSVALVVAAQRLHRNLRGLLQMLFRDTSRVFVHSLMSLSKWETSDMMGTPANSDAMSGARPFMRVSYLDLL